MSPHLKARPLRTFIAMLLMLVVASALQAATESPVITSPTTANGTVGVAFSYQITATQDPTSFSAAGLPSGLSYSTATGLISGTPTTAGLSTVAISASNAFGTGNGSVNITISGASGPPVISSPASTSATVGVEFSYQIVASNTPFSYSASNLPNGISLSTTTGLISGTPTLAGTWSATIGATNTLGTGTASVTITVVDPAPPVPGTAPQITSSLDASGRVSTPFSYAITATNAPTSFGAAGLPSGLVIDVATGLITGTPTTSAVFNVTISATNGDGTDNETLRLSIATADGTPPSPPPGGGGVAQGDGKSCGAGSGLAVLLLAAWWALPLLIARRGP